MNSILVTGGTGFFGRAFVRQMLDDGCERICIYSRGEHAQAEFREQVNDDSRCRWFIGDVRDESRLRRVMDGVDTVVHAAALKRIEIGWYNPVEMVKTNIMGAVNIVEAAIDAGVKRVVALSSDKAYQPVSAYGTSKALAESLFLAANNTTKRTQFAACRYGNVFGSTGSVVPLWRRMIAAGATELPVTDPDCTRFYMTLQQAVDLVRNTVRDMPAEIAIPTLPAYRVGDLVEALGMKARVTGLPVWEKKHESMRDGMSSETAPRMNVDDLRRALNAL